MGKRIIFLLIILLLYGCSEKAERLFEYETGEVTLGDITISVEIADTFEKRMTGLMYREKLGELNGMLFIFQDERPRSFWMKNTLIPLDIIFINSEFEIVKIQQTTPCKQDPCPSYLSEKPAKYVVEVNMGFSEEHKVEEGMKININV